MFELKDIIGTEKPKENNKLIIYTSQYRYSGERRLDITAKKGSELFRPTFEMVMEFKASRQDQTARDKYEKIYNGMMRDTYAEFRSGWERLLKADWVVLVCFCRRDTFCHRYLLADYLVKCGAIYKGEIPNV